MSSFSADGFEVVAGVFGAEEMESFQTLLESLPEAAGHRDLMGQFPAVADLAGSAKLLALLKQRTGQSCFPVRSIFFDKTMQFNWFVPWHQDLTIAVKEQVEREGYGPWSVKNGTVHVQPPREILEGMITVRIHLDDADEQNGALKVLPATHTLGRLDAIAIAAQRARSKEVPCPAKQGDVLLMRPLLLHASAPAFRPAHRRVIHLEYASAPLAEGLAWAEALPEPIRK